MSHHFPKKRFLGFSQHRFRVKLVLASVCRYIIPNSLLIHVLGCYKNKVKPEVECRSSGHPCGFEEFILGIEVALNILGVDGL
jgi:hypothetical protein